MDQCTLYLVRHGQTKWNAEDRLQGQIDIPLNEAGIAEAHLLANEFQHHPINAVYSSHLIRAHETARIVGEPHGHEIKIRPHLQEASYGSLEGSTRAEYSSMIPSEIDDRMRFKLCPRAESYLEIYERAKPVLDEIITSHLGETVVVVTHGGLMRVVIALVAAIDVRNVRVQNIGYVKLVGDGVKITLQDYKRVQL